MPVGAKQIQQGRRIVYPILNGNLNKQHTMHATWHVPNATMVPSAAPFVKVAEGNSAAAARTSTRCEFAPGG